MRRSPASAPRVDLAVPAVRRRLAGEHGEVTGGLASVGAAVLDHLGWPAAAIAVTFAEGSPGELVAAATDAVTEAASTLSRRIRGSR